MSEHDWTPADLARETGIPEPTMRGYTSGRVKVPHSEHRALLDRRLAPGLPVGTTRAICAGTRPAHYPTEPALAVCRTAQLLKPRQAAALAELLESMLAD
jgi:hypothetical protein